MHHCVTRAAVERCHELHGKRLTGLGQKLRLCRRRQNADAERLCQKQHVTLLRARVREHLVRVDKARDGETILRLVVENGVPTRDERACLVDLVVSAAQKRVYSLLRHVGGNGHDVQAELRLAAHCVDVGQGVCRGDLAEGIRVVGDGREKVHSLHQRQLVRDLIDRGVVTPVKADEQIRVLMDADALEQPRQHARADLCAASGAFCEFGQFDRVMFHRSHPQCVFTPKRRQDAGVLQNGL